MSGDAGGEGRAKELPFRRFSGERVAANGAANVHTNSRPPPTAPDRNPRPRARARHTKITSCLLGNSVWGSFEPVSKNTNHRSVNEDPLRELLGTGA